MSRPRQAVRAARRDARRQRSSGSPSCRWEPNFRFELPAIESLDGGYAHLVNGWEVRYADVIDRSRCEDGEATDVAAESFSEFLRLAGENHRSLYDLGRGELIAVVC